MPYKDKEKGREHHRVYMRGWYAKNKAKHANWVKINRGERKKRLADFIRDIKANLKCGRCGESHPACLDFHHKEGTKKRFAVAFAPARGVSRETILAEIEKCEVVCANCHRKIHYDLRQEAKRIKTA